MTNAADVNIEVDDLRNLRVLVVEDDDLAARTLARILAQNAMIPHVATTGRAAEELIRKGGLDAIILDIGLPDGDGVRLCEIARDHLRSVPILMLTGDLRLGRKVEAFNAGADDYITKPFAIEELLVRLRALRRRASEAAGERRLGDLTLDLGRRSVRLHDREIALTPHEFDLLVVLSEHQGEPVSRADLWRQVWHRNDEPLSNAVDVFIANLRRKVWGGASISPIETVRGVGYVFR